MHRTIGYSLIVFSTSHLPKTRLISLLLVLWDGSAWGYTVRHGCRPRILQVTLLPYAASLLDIFASQGWVSGISFAING